MSTSPVSCCCATAGNRPCSSRLRRARIAESSSAPGAAAVGSTGSAAGMLPLCLSAQAAVSRDSFERLGWEAASTKDDVELAGRESTTPQIALTQLAPKFLQGCELFAGLDALRDGDDANGAGKTDHTRDDGGVVWVGAKPRDEAAIDLQLIDRKPLEIDQA